MDKNVLKLNNENGEEVLYEVLLDFTSDEFNKSYMVIAPLDATQEGGQISVTPVTYTKDDEGAIAGIGEIETREEFDLVKGEFEKMMSEMHHHEHGEGCGCDHGDDDHECCGGHNHDEDHECCGGHNHE